MNRGPNVAVISARHLEREPLVNEKFLTIGQSALAYRFTQVEVTEVARRQLVDALHTVAWFEQFTCRLEEGADDDGILELLEGKH